MTPSVGYITKKRKSEPKAPKSWKSTIASSAAKHAKNKHMSRTKS
jgi:hypothetical protein